MTVTEDIIQALQAERDALYREGIEHLDLFGSVARGDGNPQDVDICVELREATRRPGFAEIGHISALRERLCRIVGRPVDLVIHPVSKPRLREQIERDGIRAF